MEQNAPETATQILSADGPNMPANMQADAAADANSMPLRRPSLSTNILPIIRPNVMPM